MIPEPLHPAVVHFPIVLVVLLPLVAIVALVMIHRGTRARTAWVPVLAVALLLAVSAWTAVQTGEREEDRVEEVVERSAIHDHEEAAELFMPLSFGVFLLIGAGLVEGRLGQGARYAGTAAAVLLLVAGYEVGHTGGDLVYEYGAASAYVSDSGSREEAPRSSRSSRREEH